MSTPVELMWARVLSRLRRTDTPTVSFAEVAALGLRPEDLVASGVFAYDGIPIECPVAECEVEPYVDFDSRAAEGAIGVACAGEPACLREWTWLPRAEHERLRVDLRQVFAAVAGRNGLTVWEESLPAPFVALGRLSRRGITFGVVWTRATTGLELAASGLKRRLGDPVLVLCPSVDARVLTPGVASTGLPKSESVDLGLGVGVDLLTPGYRTRVLEDPALDLDYVRLRFATRPGDRHILEINGHDFGGFRKSDVKFLRMLLLAAARKNGVNGGWLDKSRLRDGDDKDRALERMREELVTYDVPDLPEAERRALIRASKGQLRLGVPPENIEFDESLAKLEFVAPTTTVRSGGAKGKTTQKQTDGLKNASILLRDCRRLGTPGAT